MESWLDHLYLSCTPPATHVYSQCLETLVGVWRIYQGILHLAVDSTRLAGLQRMVQADDDQLEAKVEFVID